MSYASSVTVPSCVWSAHVLSGYAKYVPGSFVIIVLSYPPDVSPEVAIAFVATNLAATVLEPVPEVGMTVEIRTG